MMKLGPVHTVHRHINNFKIKQMTIIVLILANIILRTLMVMGI